MRIYIVGAAGSGKTTLAKKVADKTGVECYHLDDIFYEDEKGNQRSETERKTLFENIINKSEWIIEDNGSRTCFAEAINAADKILLLCPHKLIRAERIIRRYIKQKIGIEQTSYQPTLKLLKRMLNGSSRFESGEDGVTKSVSRRRDKAFILKTNMDINTFINSL